MTAHHSRRPRRSVEGASTSENPPRPSGLPSFSSSHILRRFRADLYQILECFGMNGRHGNGNGGPARRRTAEGHRRVHSRPLRPGPAHQARGVTGRGHPWRHDRCVAGGGDDRAGIGAGTRPRDQACDQAGRPIAQQQGHRCLGQLRPLGAASDRHARGDRRCHGLDRLRRRRPGHSCAQSRDRPWPGDAIVVAVRMEGRVEGSAQRLRGCVSAAIVTDRPARLPCHHPGRPRLR